MQFKILFVAIVAGVCSCQKCTLLTSGDLEDVIVDIIEADDGSSTPTVNVMRFHPVCLALDEVQDRYRAVSVIVEYTCSANTRCPPGTAVEQIESECDNGVWSNVVRSATEFTRSQIPEANFSTSTRQDCVLCVSPELNEAALLGYSPDSVTHCVACDSSCSEGLMGCFGFGSNRCCNYYNNSMCVDECLSPFQPNTANECICPVGTTGFNCAEAVDCGTLNDPDNGEVLVSSTTYTSVANYSCNTGYILEGETTRTCQESGLWTGSEPSCTLCDLTCDNGGTPNLEECSVCECPSGYSGNQCESDIDECSISSACFNGGVCTNTDGGYTCSCPSGYSGNQCESDIDECSIPGSCFNGGVCTNTDGGYTCSCSNGYTGNQCESDIDECSTPSSCFNGICTNTDGGYTCSCSSGYTGNQCESDIDECSIPSSCLNGVCTNTDGGYTCSCSSGYTGNKCESDIDECSTPSSCFNGICINTNGGYMCNCFEGYEGSTCNVDTDDCLSADCQNGATCSDRVAGYLCVCRDGSTGEKCELCDISNCQRCNTATDPIQCSQCQPGYTLSDTGVCECGVEYCSVCSDVPEKCSECSTGYILTDGVCEVQCKVENCLKCVETSGSRCNTCQNGYVMVDGQCNNKATGSDEDNGLSDIEIAAIIAGVIIFLVLLLFILTCIAVPILKRLCRKGAPENRKISPQDVKMAKHTRANPAYVSGVRESQFEAQVTLGLEEDIEMHEKNGDDEEMDGDSSSEDEQASGDEEEEPHRLL